MSASLLVGVALLGRAGAVACFLLDGAVAARAGRYFPWGTLTVTCPGRSRSA